jgi:hypothetical protein
MKTDLMAGAGQMTEGGGQMPETMPAMSSSEICVPTESLAMPDETEQMEAPEVGDVVDFQGSGKVSRIEGDKTYLTLETVNGKPVKTEEAAAPADDFAGVEQQAENAGYLG